ncbi:glutaredoxin family protein [Bacillaceae bacterium Marseille-Q3522]|nr:glutaredoxin family protein [Bacillaceae bacterium Marseille-Q3522]
MGVLILYTRKQCPLCDKAKKIIQELQTDWPFEFKEIDIVENEQDLEAYGLMIPVVKWNGKLLQYGQIQKDVILKAFSQK